MVARRAGQEKYRFAVVDGEVRGISGYHAGELVNVVRRADGSVSHLDIATFVYTRTPYDPDAPIPGGHPGPTPLIAHGPAATHTRTTPSSLRADPWVGVTTGSSGSLGIHSGASSVVIVRLT